MTARQRSAILALLLVLGCLTLRLTARSGALLWAGPKAVPAHTAQEVRPGVVEIPSVPPPEVDAPAGSPCPVDPPTPVVGLRVRVPASIGAGQEIDYRIIVENRSEADAHQVIVRNPLPANARFVRAIPEPTAREPELVWRLGTLPACTYKEIVLILAPTGAGDVSNCARVQFEHGQCVVTRLARPRLQVRLHGPTQAGLNDTLPYQISVTNVGEVPATNVGLLEKLPDGLEHASGKNTLAWTLGTLAPGQTQQVVYQVVARKAGRQCSRVAASGDGGAFDEAESCVEVVPQAPVPPPPALSVSLVKLGPQQRFLGRPATYQLTVTNPSTAPLTNVVLTDLLPPQTTLVSASDGGRLSGTQVQWLLGTLPPGSRRTVQVALQTQQPGEIVNRATVTADRGVTANAEARTLFEGATGLTFDLEVKDNPVEVGTATTYIVSVLNQGQVPATKVQVTLTLPEQMEFSSAKGPTNHRQEGRQVIFEAMPTLASRAEVRFEVNVKALVPGEVRCKAELRADQLGERPVLREQSTTIYK